MFSFFRFFTTNLNDFRRSLACPRLPLVRLNLSCADPHPTSVSHRSFPFAPPFAMALRVCSITFLNCDAVGAYGCSAAAEKCLVIPWTLRNFLRYLHGSMPSRFGLVVSPASTTFACLSTRVIALSELLTRCG